MVAGHDYMTSDYPPNLPRWCAAIALANPPPHGCAPADVVAWFGSFYAVSSVAEAEKLAREAGEGLAVYSIVVSSHFDHDGLPHPTIDIRPIVAPTRPSGTAHTLFAEPSEDDTARARPRTRGQRGRPPVRTPDECRRAYEIAQDPTLSWAAVARVLSHEGILAKSGFVIRSHVAKAMARHHVEGTHAPKLIRPPRWYATDLIRRARALREEGLSEDQIADSLLKTGWRNRYPISRAQMLLVLTHIDAPL